MSQPKLELRFIKFSRGAFVDEIQRLAGASPDAKAPDQVRYLASYLSHADCAAQTLVVEDPYVDRHYLEEYAGYYATLFSPPKARVTRVHIFRQALTSDDFEKYLTAAHKDPTGAVTAELTKSYFGFVVVRPLPAAPIGRTILRSYQSSPDRVYGPYGAPHVVHLAGLELRVTGTPFQQQDQGVGACATAALWSSLARVVRTDGGRAPTPLSITMAATRFNHEGRVLPAEAGLGVDQMCSAVRELGYAPFLFRPAEEHALFLMALQCYVRSGMPPVLHVSDAGKDAHAITVVGFRGSHPEGDPPPLTRTVSPSHSIVTDGMSRLYVHDDRFGAYARMKWLPPEAKGELPRLQFSPDEEGYEHLCQPMKIWVALVPLYPKLRLSATDLIEFSAAYIGMLKYIAGEGRRGGLRFRFRFVQGGMYLSDLLKNQRIAAHRTARFLRSVLLPRYVGVIEAWLDDGWFCDFILDSTDIKRPSPVAPPLLAVVPREEDNGTIANYLPSALVA